MSGSAKKALSAGTPRAQTPSEISEAWLTPKTLRQAANVLNVGLSLLEGNSATRPYAQALRVVTSVGARVAPNQGSSPFVFRIKELRQHIKTLAQVDNPTTEQTQVLRQLEAQCGKLLDLYLARL
jgi:hypothetical protein